MIFQTPVVIRHTLLAAITACVLSIILVAGLWPFWYLPANNVTWLISGGVRLGKRGLLLSSSSVQQPQLHPVDKASSLEICLQADASRDVRDILTFYDAQGVQTFTLFQFRSVLLFQGRSQGATRRSPAPHFGIDGIFQGQLRSITITSNGTTATVYMDGALLGRFPNFGLESQDLDGQLVLGSSPKNDPWSGIVRGLAIYNSQISPSAVAQHFQTWQTDSRPTPSSDEHLVALYTFNERAGTTVHNQSGPAPDLYIPSHFFIPHEELLMPVWESYRPGWGFFLHALENIAGFIPLGFFLAAYLSTVWNRKRAVFFTILFGAALSLSMEIVQSYMPTRDSDMMDFLGNTTGTIFGAAFFCWNRIHTLLARIGFCIQQ